MQFLKNILSSFIGTFLAFIVSIFILIAMLVGIVTMAISGFTESTTEIPQKTILKLSLNAPLVERAEDNPFASLDLPYKLSPDFIGLLDLIKTIERATYDANIEALYINVDEIMAGYAMLEELRAAIENFKKESGKPVYAYSEQYSEKAYFLASVADEIYLNPVGMLEFKGLSSEIMFFHGMFEKLGLEAKIFRVGNYKSAVEPFFRKDMSKANREQISEYVESIYSHVLSEIAISRNMNADDLRMLSDSGYITNAGKAKQYKLVDDTLYYDQLIAIFRSKLNLEENDQLNVVSIHDYGQNQKLNSIETSSGERIAVIIAEGTINGGDNEQDVIGSEATAKEIRKARLDKDIKAIVLRINSPGGSALASDVMWREIMLARQEKPVIASMSNLAASGGYYMAMACDSIVAYPTTLTGSIGVWGLLINAEQFMGDKLGITFDRVKTGEYADIGNPFRPMTKKDSTIIQKEVNRIYTDFVAKAAKDRRMSVSDLEKVAGGRVWSGNQALERGLVDKLGGLNDAVKMAANAAGLSDYKVEYLPEQKDFFTRITKDYSASQKQIMLKEELGPLYPLYRQTTEMKTWDVYQTRLPYNIIIE